MKKDVDEALKWFRAAAEQGDSAYQYQLALSLHQGRLAFRDGKQDMPEVFKWYRAAAVQGEIDALRALSHLYGQGGDVEKDDAEALKWLRMAAGWGDESSQGLLGDRYASGTGVAKDEVEAFAYYRLASVYPSNPTQKNGRAGESCRIGVEDVSGCQGAGCAASGYPEVGDSGEGQGEGD